MQWFGKHRTYKVPALLAPSREILTSHRCCRCRCRSQSRCRCKTCKYAHHARSGRNIWRRLRVNYRQRVVSEAHNAVLGSMATYKSPPPSLRNTTAFELQYGPDKVILRISDVLQLKIFDFSALLVFQRRHFEHITTLQETGSTPRALQF